MLTANASLSERRLAVSSPSLPIVSYHITALTACQEANFRYLFRPKAAKATLFLEISVVFVILSEQNTGRK